MPYTLDEDRKMITNIRTRNRDRVLMSILDRWEARVEELAHLAQVPIQPAAAKHAPVPKPGKLTADMRTYKRIYMQDWYKGIRRRKAKCSCCGVNLADLPSKLCPGCEAYRDHQR